MKSGRSSRVSLIALGLGAYLAFAVASFPASIAHRWFAPDGLALASVEGTIWRGSAGYGGIRGLAFSDLRWQLKPAPLVTGRISLTAESRIADGFASASVSASGGRIELRDVRAGTSLSGLAAILPLGGAEGQISLSLDSLELVDGWPVSAAGEARIAELSIVPIFPTPGYSQLPLGNFDLRFTESESPGIVGIVTDTGGPLEVAGRIELSADRSYVFDLLIKPRADAPSVLVDGLNLMTEAPNASGQRRFLYRDSL